jgi:predicted nucleic-acid-binding Zn-ribbon protein
MPSTEAKGLDVAPQCVKCGSKMRFSCTEPDKPGFVHHAYECTKCRSTQSYHTSLAFTYFPEVHF